MPLAAIGIEFVRLRRMRRDSRVEELLFEGRKQLQSGFALQPVERAPQDVARAIIPKSTVGRLDVADEEEFRRAAVERHEHAAARIGNEKDFAHGTEGRNLDGAECR